MISAAASGAGRRRHQKKAGSPYAAGLRQGGRTAVAILYIRQGGQDLVLNNLRGRLEPALQGIGRRFAATGLSPNVWTSVGLVFAFASAAAYGAGYEMALIVGGVLLLVSGFFDVVDGQVARVAKKASPKGSFLDSVFDKVAEVAIFLGILVGGHAEPYLVLLAVTLSLLVSYSRSKAESLNVKLQGVGIGERAERLLVIAIVGAIPGLMEVAVVAVVVIAAATLIQRTVHTAKSLG